MNKVSCVLSIKDTNIAKFYTMHFKKNAWKIAEIALLMIKIANFLETSCIYTAQTCTIFYHEGEAETSGTDAFLMLKQMVKYLMW